MCPKCPKCKDEVWRADVHQSVDVEVDKDFYPADIGFDFSEPEVIKESVYCDNCGFQPFKDEPDDLKLFNGINGKNFLKTRISVVLKHTFQDLPRMRKQEE